MKLADLEAKVLPAIPTSTLVNLGEIEDCRVSAELYQRLTILATWGRRRADGELADALERIGDWARSKAQELDWVISRRNERRSDV
jgi:hypothetical protein